MTATTIKFIKTRRVLTAGFIILLLLTAGCGPTVRPSLIPKGTQGTPQVFRPAPPVISTPTAIQNTSELVKPQATPTCLDNLSFVSDATIPDGTEVEAKSTLDKRWEVKNSGNCGWDEHYRLRLIAGPAMNAPQEQALFPGRSGSQVFLEVVFEAPAESGHFRSAWQAYNPSGQPFGDPIFIDINVK
jgi:hypothetical protein